MFVYAKLMTKLAIDKLRLMFGMTKSNIKTEAFQSVIMEIWNTFMAQEGHGLITWTQNHIRG